MLTLFALPKPFAGHTGVIQNNAFGSWSQLSKDIQVIIFGDEDGVGEAAKRHGFEHVPEIARNEYGTPYLSDLFACAKDKARFPNICYINSDIILVDGFDSASRKVIQTFPKFLMIGQRWDLDIRTPLNIQGTDWRSELRSRVTREGVLHPQSGIDYFFFSKDLYANMPPLIIGRIAWDNWLVWEARRSGAVVVDATEELFAVHQEHDYGHVKGGKAAAWDGPEAQRNRALTGMTTGVEGYIQNAAMLRFHNGELIHAVKGVKRDPKAAALAVWPSVLDEVTGLIEQSNFSAALERLETFAPYGGANSGFNFTCAVAFYHLGHLEEAAKACQIELTVNPSDAASRNLLAAIQAALAARATQPSPKNTPAVTSAEKPIQDKSENSQEGSLAGALKNIGWSDRIERYNREIKQVAAGTGNPAEISVVMHVTQHPERVREIVGMLRKSASHKMEVILVVDGSVEIDSATAGVVDTIVYLNFTLNRYFASNIGAAFAKAPVILFYEEDAYPGQGLVDAHVETYRQYEAIGVRGARLARLSGEFNPVLNEDVPGDKPHPRMLDGESNFSIDAKAFFAVGGFVETMPPFAGGMAISAALIKSGVDARKLIYQPGVAVRQDIAHDQASLNDWVQRRQVAFEYIDQNHFIFRSAWNKYKNLQELLIPKGKPTDSSGHDRTGTDNSPLAMLIDREQLFLDHNFLTPDDYKGKSVLIAGAGRIESYPWLESAAKVVHWRGESTLQNQSLPKNSSLVTGKFEELNAADGNFDIAIISDLGAVGSDLPSIVGKVSKMLKHNSTLIVAAKTNAERTDIKTDVIAQFEKQFVVELEEHLEWDPWSPYQFLGKNRTHVIHKMAPVRPLIVTAKLRRVGPVSTFAS